LTEIINIKNVSVKFKNNFQALTSISAKLNSPKIVGLVGMNGAGKSTLFKTIMGIIKPTSGEILIMGMSPAKALKKSLVSYVPQIEEVDWNFPLLVEDLVMMGRYSHMNFFRYPSKIDHEIVDEAINFVDINEFRKSQIGELSGGQKKRAFVARSLAQRGKIILLDEPFTGVDVTTEESLSELFRLLANAGNLVVVSTHNLGSVPQFCDDVMLINRKLIAYGSIETAFTQENLRSAFGSMFREHRLSSIINTRENSEETFTIITDDERPVVFYGKHGVQAIKKSGKNLD
jgi:manganese/iron transport system ATP-binding protein